MRRTSHHINRKPASNVLHAVRMAEALGRPLNQFVTINFGKTACTPEEAGERFEKLRDNRFGPWLRRPRKGQPLNVAPPTYAWSFEAAGGVLAVHWLVHIPVGRVGEFREKLPQWLDAVASITCPSAIDVRYAPKPMGAAKYALKGIDPIYAPVYDIQAEAQGIVHGKRSGVSACLGPTMRRRMQEEGRYRKPRRVGPRPPMHQATT